MRNPSKASIFILVLIPLLFSNAVLGAESQSIVAGIGVGGLIYSGTDDVRTGYFTDEPTTAALGETFLEWYPVERLGIGGHRMQTISSDANDGTISVISEIFTAQVIPIVFGGGKFRLGARAGAGWSRYKYIDGFGDAYITKGTVTELGYFLDWGGTGFGIRIGSNTVKTNFNLFNISPATGLNADGSGSHWFLDLRWGFE